MKKFEELERMQQELAVQNGGPSSSTGQTTSENTETPPTVGDFSMSASMESSDVPADVIADAELAKSLADGERPEAHAGFTQAQLEELFKRTSAFTVKSAHRDDLHLEDELDDVELWRLDNHDMEDDDWREEDDYQVLDDDFWDEEFGAAPSRSGIRRIERGPRIGGRRADHDSVLARYKVMQVQMQDRHGNFFVMKKRISAVDPSLPTYVRIPPVPVPRSWLKVIQPYVPASTTTEGSRYFESDILSFPFKTLGKKFQVIHMNPPFLLPKEPPTPGKISVDQFATLPITSLIPYGFLFIWSEKELTPHILQAAERWGFRYVENFCWVKRGIDNRIVREESPYFLRSKVTCLILRKEGDVELRHQRNPDCEFDFVKPIVKGQVMDEKPSFIYDVIETLLPQAAYSKDNTRGDGMLDL
ncbi:hypothetical protein HK097_010158 [Rhizophlyctis rosea]|uniref:Uncharacterized protein n=1 Tax=Rhizophlyctis rosea TaxID=64517 RepID=A0AAD5SJ16_9FUNG|nr:hypothetical protein HK097_010158 [Rhizophlyctis rosea]